MTIDRILKLIDRSRGRPRHLLIARALIYQLLATAASRQPIRCVPRFSDKAKMLREFAVEDFNTAVRQGFVDC